MHSYTVAYRILCHPIPHAQGVPADVLTSHLRIVVLAEDGTSGSDLDDSTIRIRNDGEVDADSLVSIVTAAAARVTKTSSRPLLMIDDAAALLVTSPDLRTGSRLLVRLLCADGGGPDAHRVVMRFPAACVWSAGSGIGYARVPLPALLSSLADVTLHTTALPSGHAADVHGRLSISRSVPRGMALAVKGNDYRGENSTLYRVGEAGIESAGTAAIGQSAGRVW